MMKTAISLPDKLYREAEAAARALGLSRSQLSATALAAYLERHRSDRITEQLNAVYSEQTAKVDDVLNRMQLASLPSASRRRMAPPNAG